MRIAGCALALVLAVACQPAGDPAVGPQAVEPGAPAGPIVIGGVDVSQPVRALGTEPFWGVTIRPDALVYGGVDRPETQMANPGPRRKGDAVVIAADARGEAFTVTLRDATCSDGMSDRLYPLKAEVRYRGETLEGCAMSEAAMAASPPP